ncbi:Endonuclease, Uma2 family (restriction endonuclease fold) [Ornithinimicrobium cerasi]|uniref:Endonuclease, Uma2 family (Restriction endonuclease fold) n=2 Tax=Ornithinimicrobium cerasi TaxID=2248773 RepID=A0A285VMA7_9MICO|nr:Endonuclease, Uma2 family (restriction endonuclease fold) [Ornithinimicrobium cerasi]
MTGMQLLTDRADAYRVGRAEFEAIRDRPLGTDRYELLDGEVLLTPSPSPVHQEVVSELVTLLRPLTPPHWSVLSGPLDVELRTADGDTVLQPDLLIAHRGRLTAKGHDGPPVLVVEVLSPTTWQRDLGVKMAAYAQAGVPHYWVVAPTTCSITIYELGPDAAYVERHHAEGQQRVEVTAPVEVVLSPTGLLGPARSAPPT